MNKHTDTLVEKQQGDKTFLLLSLPGRKTRHIGEIENGVFKTTRNPNLIYRNLNAFSFNADLINRSDIEIFEVNYLGEMLYVTKEYLQLKGIRMKHKNFELQIFLPLYEFSKSIETAKLKDRKAPEQLTLSFGS